MFYKGVVRKVGVKEYERKSREGEVLGATPYVPVFIMGTLLLSLELRYRRWPPSAILRRKKLVAMVYIASIVSIPEFIIKQQILM